ncbi:hypothetical protein, partial [Pseudomonas syringae group genomosp. 7]|uniref:hypothetical protein n=1 Tax=Pseudomonas syringae group genomosp. 7 TaxID=251699 RepID=UPI0037703C91
CGCCVVFGFWWFGCVWGFWGWCCCGGGGGVCCGVRGFVGGSFVFVCVVVCLVGWCGGVCG